MSLRFEKRGHRYTLNGKRLPSVTGIISEGVPKPALKPWGERTVAEFAYDHRDAWVNLPRAAAVDMLKRTPYRQSTAKAALGSAVHAAIARHVEGLEPQEDLSDEAWGYFNGALRYFEEQRVKVLYSEALVYNASVGYAGTLDLQIVQERGEGVELADFKTSKEIYPEVALQLVGYARAEFIVTDEGEVPMPEVTGAVGVRLDPSGDYEAVPLAIDSRVWAAFLHARGVREWRLDVAPTVLGEPLRRAA